MTQGGDQYFLLVILVIVGWPLFAIPRMIFKLFTSTAAGQDVEDAPVKVLVLSGVTVVFIVAGLAWLFFIAVFLAEWYIGSTCEGGGCAQLGVGTTIASFFLWVSYAVAVAVRRLARRQLQ